MKITAFLHHPPGFARHSGMYPLVEALSADPVFYAETWRKVQNRHWRPGYMLKYWGDAFYGSGWNALLPGVDEWRLARNVKGNPDVLHFIWAEFASPARERWFRKGKNVLVGTFHASARKLPDVIRANYRGLNYFDGITLMSETQRSFFLERGYPDENIRVVLHGVVTDYFKPAPREAIDVDQPLRGLLVGSTERDHAMMANVLRKLPPDVLQMIILTNREQRRHYTGLSGIDFPSHLSDESFLCAYQQADLLVMPMLDCTANNAIMESMACGTPVMVNRVGGISEYVDPGCNVILDEHTVDAWVDRLMYWKNNRDKLEAMRTGARAWAKKFDWGEKAREYVEFYRYLLAGE